MTNVNSVTIDVEAIEREARKLRAEYTAQMVSNARAWVSAKLSAVSFASAKTA